MKKRKGKRVEREVAKEEEETYQEMLIYESSGRKVNEGGIGREGIKEERGGREEIRRRRLLRSRERGRWRQW